MNSIIDSLSTDKAWNFRIRPITRTKYTVVRPYWILDGRALTDDEIRQELTRVGWESMIETVFSTLATMTAVSILSGATIEPTGNLHRLFEALAKACTAENLPRVLIFSTGLSDWNKTLLLQYVKLHDVRRISTDEQICKSKEFYKACYEVGHVIRNEQWQAFTQSDQWKRYKDQGILPEMTTI